MKKIATRKLVVTTTTIRELTAEALSEVVGGHPLTGIPNVPVAPIGRRTVVGR